MSNVRKMKREGEEERTPTRSISETITTSPTFSETISETSTSTNAPTQTSSLSHGCTSNSTSPKDIAQACANDVECSKAFANSAQANPNGAAGQAIRDKLKNQCGELSQAVIGDNEGTYIQSQQCSSSTNPAACVDHSLHVSAYEYRKFSNDVYYVPTDPKRPQLPTGWDTYKNSPSNTYDYFGRAYIKRDTTPKLIVIAHRGTDINFGNFFTDFQFLVSNPPYALCLANDFTDSIATSQDCLNDGCCLSFTGHSLGGGLAELSTLKFTYPAFAFDSPGMRTLAESNMGSSFCAVPGSFTISDYTIRNANKLVTNYVSGLNLVNTMGVHFGNINTQVFRLNIPFMDPGNFTFYGIDGVFLCDKETDCPLKISVYYSVLYTAYQHKGIIDDSASYNRINGPIYDANGEPRFTTQYPDSLFTESKNTASCLEKPATTFGEYVMGGFAEACAWDDYEELVCSTKGVDTAYGYLDLAIPVSKMFPCSAGRNVFASYDYNTPYWMFYMSKEFGINWQSNSDAVSVMQYITSLQCSYTNKEGVTINVNDNAIVWTTTNCNDMITIKGNSNKIYTFCGDDTITDSGNTNEYHYPTNYLNGYESICGHKTISAVPGSSSIIIIDAYLTKDGTGEPVPNGQAKIAGYSYLFTMHSCGNTGSFYLISSDSGIPFFASWDGAVSKPFNIFADFLQLVKNNIQINSFHWGDFGIVDHSSAHIYDQVVVSDSPSCTAASCLAAIGCGNSGAATITIQSGVSSATVFGTPAIPVAFTLQSTTIEMNIMGIKVGDSIVLPYECLDGNVLIETHNGGTSWSVSKNVMSITANIASGGQKVCLQCEDLHFYTISVSEYSACSSNSVSLSGSDTLDSASATPTPELI